MNKRINTGIFCVAGMLMLAGSAHAATTATFTADNHYALYADYGGSLSLVGANESGTGGAPGSYNWSMAESFTFITPDTMYIAAWSDDKVAQGLVGQFNFDGVDVFTGDAGWEVFATGISLNDGAPAPDAALIAAQVALADLNGLWELPYVGFDNVSATDPWGKIAGVSEDANWVWRSSGRGGPNPLLGDYDHDEFLIFRTTPVPTTGAASVLALGGIATIRRRRKA
jgi:MYXO-CTERM domain-containing protein